MKSRAFLLSLVLGLATACGDSTRPVEDPAYLLGLPFGGRDRPESALTFAKFEAAESPTIRSADFWAVVGKQRSIAIPYASGDAFLRFTVGPASLLKKPNGLLFHPGDSIHITVTLDEDDRMIARFEPSGLIFNPIAPARLLVSYEHADPDLDGDGDVDEADAAIRSELGVWKQELLGLPWLQLPSLKIGGIELFLGIQSFTGFAVASS